LSNLSVAGTVQAATVSATQGNFGNLSVSGIISGGTFSGVVRYIDTAAMLSSRIKYGDTATLPVFKQTVRTYDTANMLLPYVRSVNAFKYGDSLTYTPLVNKISRYDTAPMLLPYARIADAVMQYQLTDNSLTNIKVTGTITAATLSGALSAGALASITSIGTLTGITVAGGIINLNNNSNFATNINTGTSNGAVSIANGTVGGNTISIGNNVSTTGIVQRVGTGNYSLDGAATSTYSIGAATTTGTIVIGGTAQTGAGTITVGRSSASNTLNLGTGTGLTTVNIATGSTLSNTVVIGGSGTSVGIGSTPSGTYKLEVFGKLKTNAINETSDIRYKKDITTVENALGKVLALRGVNYLWRRDEFPEKNFDDTKQLGVIAQEVEKIIPEVVRTDEKGFKSVEYSKMVALLIEAIKDQQKTIDEMKADIKNLKSEAGRVTKLEADMARLKALVEEMIKKESKAPKK
ncbi:MAG: tail fiber domain-containing protein, partial [Sediminibacterium sp.]